jgi:hypothetical protein
MMTEVTIEENATILTEITSIMTSAKSSIDKEMNFQETNSSNSEEEFLIWAIIDGLLLIAILCGNVLTILAVRYSRRLRSVISNLFVLSLAISDILVGLTLPYHLAFYLGSNLGSNKHLCLLRFFFVIMACCVSIWNLISIALDRYLAICYPLHYSRWVNGCHSTILRTGSRCCEGIYTVRMTKNNYDCGCDEAACETASGNHDERPKKDMKIVTKRKRYDIELNHQEVVEW